MMKSNYDKTPKLRIQGYDNEAWSGKEAICAALKDVIAKAGNTRTVLTVECYPGVEK